MIYLKCFWFDKVIKAVTFYIDRCPASISRNDNKKQYSNLTKFCSQELDNIHKKDMNQRKVLAKKQIPIII